MVYDAKRDITTAVRGLEATREPAVKGQAKLEYGVEALREGLDLFKRAIDVLDGAGQWLAQASQDNGYVGLRANSIHELFSIVALGNGHPLVDEFAEKKDAYAEMNAHTKNSAKLIESLVGDETTQLHQIKTILEGVVVQTEEFLGTGRAYNESFDQVHSEAVVWRDSI